MPHGHHGHEHSQQDDHSHSSAKSTAKSVLIIALILAFGFAAIEAFFGWYANSLALLSDAGHMAADACSLALAAFAAWVAAKPPSPRHSYGLGRAEVLGAWVSSIFLVVIVLTISIEAVDRIFKPEQVHGPVIIFVALTGVAINLLIMWILSHGERNINIRAAILHVLGDLLGSAGAMIAGIVIYFTDWTPIDPILSIFIAVLILISSLRLLKESMHILMEAVPVHIDYENVGKAMITIKHITSIHDLHIWTLPSGTVALSAHVEIDHMGKWESVLAELKTLLNEKYHITHATLQPECSVQIIQPMQPPLNSLH